MNRILLFLSIIFFGMPNVIKQNLAYSANMNQRKISNVERYQNVSTAPSAVRLLLRDAQTKETFNVIVRNDDFFYFLQKEKGFDVDQYIRFMSENDGTAIELNLELLKSSLWERWNSKKEDREKYFSEKIVLEKSYTIKDLDVTDINELLSKYFNCDPDGRLCILKSDYYDRFNRNPSFVSLLIDLGCDVGWGDYVPALEIRLGN